MWFWPMRAHELFRHDARQWASLCSQGMWLFLRSVPSECPQGVEDLWRRCTLQDPGERPSASAALEALLALLHVKRPSQALTDEA